ncbi:MAG: hypothetical protein RH917_19475 [Lacipirellulaceae bacterium]
MLSRIRILSATALMLWAFCIAGTASAVNSYHIGNSLTWDSQPLLLSPVAQDLGLSHEAGYHIRTATSLDYFIANPEDVNITPVEPFGTYTNALTNHAWDAVTIQPFNGQTSTMATDVLSILDFIDLTRSNSANQDTKFYIYAAWPRRTGFRNRWTVEVEDELTTNTVPADQYFDFLIERVRQETDAEVYMIPVGDVLFELDTRLLNSEIPGFTTLNEFYRDEIHLDFNHGRYLANLTTFSTLFNTSPIGIRPTNATFGNDILTLEQLDALQLIVSDVLSQHEYANVSFPVPTFADFDSSGQVGQADFTLWSHSYGIEDPFDPNGDGKVDILDHNFWSANVTQFHPADFNRDGQVNPLDFEVWENSVGVDDGADADQDGDTDEQDRIIWEQANVPFDPADFNEDGFVDGLDSSVMLNFYGLSDQGDISGDGQTDGDDFLAFQLVQTPYNPADTNFDRLVDNVDLEHWQRSVGYDIATDINDNELTEGMELLTWQQEFGSVWPIVGASAVGVPEPVAATLVFTAFSLFLAVRTRDSLPRH